MIRSDHDYMAYLTSKYLSSSNNNLIGKRMAHLQGKKGSFKPDAGLAGLNSEDYDVKGT